MMQKTTTISQQFKKTPISRNKMEWPNSKSICNNLFLEETQEQNFEAMQEIEATLRGLIKVVLIETKQILVGKSLLKTMSALVRSRRISLVLKGTFNQL